MTGAGSQSLPKARSWRYLIGSLAVLDLACVLLALNLAAWLASHPVFGSRGTPGWGFILLMLPVFALIFVTQGLYDPAKLLGGTQEYESVFRACTYGLVAMVLISFVTRRIVSREWIVLSWACATVLVGTGRLLVMR